MKFIIERSKVAEIRQKKWGRAFWAFGHVVVNSIHRVQDEGRKLVKDLWKHPLQSCVSFVAAFAFLFASMTLGKFSKFKGLANKFKFA